MTTWLIFVIFLVLAILMVTKKLPAMLALPIMAVAIAAVAGIPWFDVKKGEETVQGIQTLVFNDGAIRLASAYSMLIFGAILGQFIKNVGIAEVVIKKAAELSGDRPLVLGLVMTLVLSLIFTTLGGLGAVIMVGSIVLPIMTSVGIPSLIAASILLISLSLGGIFNLMNWGFYQTALNLTIDQIKGYAYIFGGIFALMGVVFVVVETRRARIAWAAHPQPQVSPGLEIKLNPLSYLTPLVPLVLVIGLKWQIIPAFVVGLLWGVITTLNKDSVNTVSKSIIQGVSEGAPAIFLMIGIGMLLKTVFDPRVTQHIGPVIARILPSSALGYVAFFTILAPLALYRGPLNLWGLGLGIAALMMQSGKLAPMAIMAALLSTGQIQGVCDPTNTHNVWTAMATNTDVNDILKKTLPYVWIASFIGLVAAAIMYV